MESEPSVTLLPMHWRTVYEKKLKELKEEEVLDEKRNAECMMEEENDPKKRLEYTHRKIATEVELRGRQRQAESDGIRTSPCAIS